MINKAILVGNVGRDPEIRYFDNDQAVANFSLATTERSFKTRDGQEIPERTEWHNIVAWRGLAKLAENYIKKGTQLYIEGKIKTRSYDDANGVKKYATEIVADVIQLLGRKSDNDGSSTYPSQSGGQPASTSSAPRPPESNKVQNGPDKQPDFLSDDNGPEDDLPF
ncbi:single-stranded DNA-binding protein [Geofilum rubicundum]|uniref:Single-stranded DNA-binding protein n=1 Tax=Geofilum rubicundum JCM 15548 TaxID=1236989 RepID=A0A0E9LW73_9BACT|nr:single-stranded DNA-binding protein [Geofilum rubicundum]GAO29115.1 single-stranded DNA-binding protein [Geofilum rubicundum JCM 15548]